MAGGVSGADTEMEIREVQLTDKVVRELIAMSEAWEAEDICRGYRKNTYADLEGNQVFFAIENSKVIGYLLGKQKRSEGPSSVMPGGTAYFEVEELYVSPVCRSRGIGTALFRYLEEHLAPGTGYVMLSTATKNFRSILHFYIDELGMEFWNARLFKKLSD